MIISGGNPPRRPRKSRSPSAFRVVPAWKESLDRDGFAKALLLLAMHLDEQQKLVHTQDQRTETQTSIQTEGEDHE